MTMHVKIGSVWKDVAEVHVKVGSVWKAVEEIHTKIGSVWKVALESAAAGLNTTVTVVHKLIYNTGWTPSVDAYGFDAGDDPWDYAGTYGSIANDTFQDGGDNTRVVSSAYWEDYGSIFWFTLAGVSVPNTADTFVSIDVDGNNFTRASATYVSHASYTYWYWSVGTNPFGTSGTKDFVINV